MTLSSLVPPELCADGLRLDAIFETPGRPLEVDVGCGKGRFLAARAAKFPAVNFLGIDRLIKRLRRVDRKIAAQHLVNVRLLHTDAFRAIEYLFPAACVAAYYVFFPDPWPKRRHHCRRLFNPAFLDALYRTLADNGRVNVATDDPDYFAAIVHTVRNDPRFCEVPAYVTTEDERSNFEMLFLEKGVTIGRFSFVRLPRSEAPALRLP